MSLLSCLEPYFFIPGTTTKIYTDKDIQTDKAYPYQEEECGWEHDDKLRVSYFKSRYYFFDTDENVRVDFQNECKTKTQISYVITDTKATTTTLETLTNKTVTFDGTGYKIYGVEAYLSNTPNYSRNVSLSCQAIMPEGENISSKNYSDNPRNCTISSYYLKASQDLPSGCKNYHIYGLVGLNATYWNLNTCPFAVLVGWNTPGDQTTTTNNAKAYLGERFFAGQLTYVHNVYSHYDSDAGTIRYGTINYSFAPTTPNANNQTIDIVQTESKHKYIRGDGSTYEDPASWQTETRYIAK